MLIQFRENWRLRTGSDQWILEKSRVAKEGKQAGQVVWSVKGYFSDPRRAVVTSWKLQVLEDGETPLEDTGAILTRLDDLYQSFQDTLDKLKETPHQ